MRDIANREAGKGISAPAKDLPGHRPTGTGRGTGRIAASLGINIEDLIDEIDRLSWLGLHARDECRRLRGSLLRWYWYLWVLSQAE